MDSLSSVSPSVVLPPRNPLRHHRHHRRRVIFFPLACPKHESRLQSLSSFWSLPHSWKPCKRRSIGIIIGCKYNGGGQGEEEGRDEEVEKALQLDGSIPVTSNEFVQQVSSRAYDMRRNLQQTFDTSSYDVLEANPWRESSKAVYVLTHRENQLCTMKTRRNRSEVESELGKLFSKGGKWRKQAKQSETSTTFQMLVEDIRDGVLVFEDENEAAKYCDLLEGGGKGCEGVAEIEASSVFDLCRKMRALAVLFRRGRILIFWSHQSQIMWLLTCDCFCAKNMAENMESGFLVPLIYSFGSI